MFEKILMEILMMKKWPSFSRYFDSWPRETRYFLVEALTSKIYVPETEKMIKRSTTTTTSPITSEMIVLIYKRTNHLRETFWRKFSRESSRKVSWKHGTNLVIKKIKTEKVKKPTLHGWLSHSLIQNSSQVLDLNLMRKMRYVLTYLFLILFKISWVIVKIRQDTWRLFKNNLIFFKKNWILLKENVDTLERIPATMALQDPLAISLNKAELASMTYGVSKNKGECMDFHEKCFVCKTLTWKKLL